MANKKKVVEEEIFEEKKRKAKDIKLKSSEFNNDAETIVKRDDDPSDAIMWGFVIGFALFFILLICIICFTN